MLETLHPMRALLILNGWRAGADMTTLTVRNVDPMVKERLRVRAARNGRSMEAELRHILSDVLDSDQNSEANLADAIRRRFAPLGGVELEPHPGQLVREPALFYQEKTSLKNPVPNVESGRT
jgi:plasmid stability protein